MADGVLFDFSQLLALQRDLGRSAAEVVPEVRAVVQANADGLKRSWQDIARVTAGSHGVHYPDSITYETDVSLGGIKGEVGPDSSRPQGGMGRGFEYGSRNQPAHMDGHKAADLQQPVFEKAMGAAALLAMKPVTDG